VYKSYSVRVSVYRNHHNRNPVTYTRSKYYTMGCCFGKRRASPGDVGSPSDSHTKGERDRKIRELAEASGSAEAQEKRRLRILQENMSSSVYTVLNKDDFDAKLKEAGSNLVVVDFYATWCGPCKMISPKLEEMAKQMTDVTFLKVDVDECEDIASQYGISCMPTFMFFKNGEKVKEFSGANEEKVKEFINALK